MGLSHCSRERRPVSLTAELCERTIGHLVATLDLDETTNTPLVSAMDGSPVGAHRILQRGGVASVVYVGMTVEQFGLDSHMLFAFTPADERRPPLHVGRSACRPALRLPPRPHPQGRSGREPRVSRSLLHAADRGARRVPGTRGPHPGAPVTAPVAAHVRMDVGASCRRAEFRRHHTHGRRISRPLAGFGGRRRAGPT